MIMARTQNVAEGSRSATSNRTLRGLAIVAAVAMLAGCGDRNLAADEDSATKPGPASKFDPDAPSVFGEGGFSVGTLNSNSSIFGGNDEGGSLPVNKYLWQGTLDTLSFLPLASTDPFTGVIATEWGSTVEAPNERLKVTAYIQSAELSAASLKVAVFREMLNEGVWQPAPVSAETARRLEDAILTRARQIRIAEIEGDTAS